MVKVGSKIELTLSTGIESNVMPNVVNLPLENAQDYLNSLPITAFHSVDYRKRCVHRRHITGPFLSRTIRSPTGRA